MENDDNAWKKLSSGKWVSSNDSWFEQAKANGDQALGILDSCNITEEESAHIVSPQNLKNVENIVLNVTDNDINSEISSVPSRNSSQSILEAGQFNTSDCGLPSLGFPDKLIANIHQRLAMAEERLDEQLDYITFLEQELSRLDQYGRRENVEILGIPARVSDQNLETEVIKILHKIGLSHIVSYSIVGCHRIGKKDRFGSRSTIVRFLHRKDSSACIQRRKLLNRCTEIGYTNLTIVENLCPSYKSIYEDLKVLKDAGKIASFWSTNGILKYKKSDSMAEKPKKYTTAMNWIICSIMRLHN